MNEAIRKAMEACENGFVSNHRRWYLCIEELLSPFSENESIASAIRLCHADTISPRFAYPHIQDILRGVLTSERKGAQDD
jgi:hypothetical protein